MEITFFENNHEKCNNINKKQEFVQLPLRKTTTTKTSIGCYHIPRDININPIKEIYRNKKHCTYLIEC